MAAVRRLGHHTGVGGQGRARGGALSQPTTIVSLFHRCGEKVQKFEALQYPQTSDLRTYLQANNEHIPKCSFLACSSCS